MLHITTCSLSYQSSLIGNLCRHIAGEWDESMNGKREIMAEKSNFLLRWRSLVSENQSDVQWLWPIHSHHFTSFHHWTKLIIWHGQRELANKRDASLQCCTCYAELMSSRFAYGHFCVHLTRTRGRVKIFIRPTYPRVVRKTKLRIVKGQSSENSCSRRICLQITCCAREYKQIPAKHVFSLICESINLARATHFLRRSQFRCSIFQDFQIFSHRWEIRSFLEKPLGFKWVTRGGWRKLIWARPRHTSTSLSPLEEKHMGSFDSLFCQCYLRRCSQLARAKGRVR